MDGFGLGTLSLQSSFVLAVLIGAVLLSERLGGDEGLARKVTQLALAFVIILTVFSGTAAFIRPPDVPESEDGLFDGSPEQEEQLEGFLKDSAERDSVAGTVHVGIGIALAVIGAALLRRLRAIPIGLTLGGILLLLLGAAPQGGTAAVTDTFSAIYAPLLSYATDAGQARDIVRFVVLLSGTALILCLAVFRWELPPNMAIAEEPTGPGEPPQPAEEGASAA